MVQLLVLWELECSGVRGQRTYSGRISQPGTHSPPANAEIFGTDASRPPGIPDIMASSSVASAFPNPLPFTSSACKGRGRQPFPKPPLQSCLSKGMERRCGGVSSHYRVQKKEFGVTKERRVSPGPCYIVSCTPSVCGADPGDIARRGQWSQ